MKLKELFNLDRERMLPNRERVRKQIAKRRGRKVRAVVFGVSALSILVLVSMGLLIHWMMPDAPVQVPLTDEINIVQSIEPTRTGVLGMNVNSDLKVVTTQNVPPAELKARLKVTPEVDYSVKKIASQTYELRFSKDLATNTVYTVAATYQDATVYRWAFQTETVFGITATPLADQTAVSLDSPIEITFSHSAVSGFEQAFFISPQVKGSFEHYGRTWAFVPDQPLDEATLYTVTIRKDLAGPEGTTLDQDHTFSFTTGAVDRYAYLLYRQNEVIDTYLVNEAPMAVVIYNDIPLDEASVKVFALKDSDALIRAHRRYVKTGVLSPDIMELAQGDPAQQFTVKPALVREFNGIYDHAAVISYPEALPLGYYFAEITLGGRQFYQLLQSTTYAVYTLTVDGEHTVWVNDSMENTVASGVKVSLEGFDSQTTDRQGLVCFKNADQEAKDRALIVGEETPYIAFLNGATADQEVEQTSKYFSYLTTNSRLFRNGDTVGIFGAVLPRGADVKSLTKATLEWDFGEETKTVEIARNGTFSAELPLHNTARSSGSIRLMVGEVCLCEAYIEVIDYELQKYYVNLETDRPVYLEGEEMQVTAYVTYMDGTPAPLIPLAIGEQKGVTNEAGAVTVVMTATAYENTYYSNTFTPQVHSLNCTVEDGTDAYYGKDISYLVVKSPYLMEGSFEDGRLNVQADQITLTKQEQIDRDFLYSDETTDLLRGVGADLQLTAELHRITYKKTPRGSTYDPINKKVIYSWQYEEQDELVRVFDLSVVDGKASAELPEKADENTNYYVNLYLPGTGDGLQVYLADRLFFNGGGRRYNLSLDQNCVNIGDRVELLVRDGENNEAINSGSVLYTVVSDRLADVFYSHSARDSITFKKEYAPDICIYGAYFDGTHIYSLGFEYLYYDQSNAALTVQMEKDQLQYRPGDEVQLTFSVTDPQGQPVQSALNISVMDRALYLIGGGNLDAPADGLFRPRSFRSTVYTTVSHREYDLQDYGYGEGGGDGSPGRSDFEDTPYFETVETDRHGKATVSFTLPDTITQWKVMVRGITTDLQSAGEVFDLVSTQGYFASAQVPATVKPTDDLTVAVKGDGLQAPGGADCQFTVGLTDRDGNQLQTLTATAPKSRYAYLNFGPQPEGVYTLYIQSACGDLQDSIIQTVTVEKSQATVWVHHQQEVGDGALLSLVPQEGTVTLTVTDQQKAFWQQAMARLHTGGDRADQALGSYLAERYYADGVFMDPEKVDRAIILSYMQYDGVRLLPNSAEADLRLSAKLAAVAPEFCDVQLLRDSFAQYLNNRYAARVDVMIAYFGLAALGEPVLADLQYLCTTVTDFSTEECAYLALGLAYSGDYDTAGYLYETYLKGQLIQQDEMLYAEDEDLTGCCALLANRLNLPDSEGLMQYIIHTDTQTTLLHLELISYLRDHAVDTVGENVVTITLGDGTTQTHRYSKTGSLVLFLNQAQASQVRVINDVGQSYVSYAYLGTPEDLAHVSEPQPLAGTEIPSSVLISEETTINLYIVVPEDFDGATFNCTLPAGLRLVSGRVTGKDYDTTIDTSYNARKITVPLPDGGCGVALTVRGALPGKYVVEPITVTNGSDPRHLATPEAEITVVT